MVRLLILGLLALLSIAPAAAEQPGTLVRIDDFPSRFVQSRKVTIWLPPGYAESTTPYAVLYMHDGQNLFETATSNFNQEWGIDEALTKMIPAHTARPTIVVGIWSTPARGQEYLPKKVFDQLPASARELVVKDFGGTPLSDEYLRFLVEELKPYIDRTYHTATGPDNTFIMGSSMGGLISLYAITEYPTIFGGAGCISTHWPLPMANMSGPLPTPRLPTIVVVNAFAGYLSKTLPKPGTHRIWFDHGTQHVDTFYGPYQQRIDRLMGWLNWVRGRDWESRVYPGATHNETAWRARVEEPLGFLLAENSR